MASNACRHLEACTPLGALARFALVSMYLVLTATPAHAQDEAQLVALINAYRSEPRRCAGERMPKAEALRPSASLARVQVDGGGNLGAALDRAGYEAASSRLVWISGAGDARAAMAVLEQHHCRALLDRRYAEVGVARSGRRWRIVLAQPLLAPDLGDWHAAGQAVLDRVNAARSTERRCGDRRFAAAPPLAWNERLAQAALAHSRDMAAGGPLGHEGSDGSTPAQRAARQGYDWRAVGENVADGQGSVPAVVDGWLDSPVHCANIMAPEFTELGAAYARDADSRLHIYWTQVFGAPR